MYQLLSCLLLWVLGHEPHPHTRAHAPNWTGPGRVRVARAPDLRTRMQFDSGDCWTCYILFFIFYFLFNILLRFFGKSWTRSRESDLHVVTTRAWSQILSGCFKQKDLQKVINTLVLQVSFTRNRKSIYPLSPTQISYIYSAKINCVLAIGFWCFLDSVFHLRATNLRLSRGLTHRPELGAGVLPGEFLPLGEEVTFKVRTRDRPSFF